MRAWIIPIIVIVGLGFLIHQSMDIFRSECVRACHPRPAWARFERGETCYCHRGGEWKMEKIK